MKNDNKILTINSEEVQEKIKSGKRLILWIDGCFDMMHYGHSNAIRQAKELFPNSYLIVGVHTDKEININKGPTVMEEKERYEAVRACKWVDKVVEGSPYTTSLKVLEAENVDYCIHGEDISLDANGNNTYQELIDAGKFLTIKRTRGVSTTNIVNRILDTGHKNPKEAKRKWSLTIKNPIIPDEERMFFPNALRISEFSNGIKMPEENDKIVYCDGAFDLFHIGHIEFLKKARELGDYLIVGIHTDESIKYTKGQKYPIMSLHERLLSLLSCKYVDDVIIGAPFSITPEMIKAYGISCVAVGTTFDIPKIAKMKEIDPYKVPRARNILKFIQSPRPDLTLEEMCSRIEKNITLFMERQKRKKSEKKIFEEIEKSK